MILDDLRKLINMNIIILDLTIEVMKKSIDIRKHEGLLTNDSFIVTFMSEQGITKLVTADGDFDQVVNIEVYKPVIFKEA